MSNSESGKYSRHEAIYHIDTMTVPMAIDAVAYTSILEALPDDEYIPLFKPISFILDKLKCESTHFNPTIL